MDPWSVLGVSRWANRCEIDAAWRREILKLDPKRHGDLVVFARLLVAYQLVTQPEDQRGRPLTTDLDESPDDGGDANPQALLHDDVPPQRVSVSNEPETVLAIPESLGHPFQTEWQRAQWLGFDSAEGLEEALIEARRHAHLLLWTDRLRNANRCLCVVKVGIGLSLLAGLGWAAVQLVIRHQLDPVIVSFLGGWTVLALVAGGFLVSSPWNRPEKSRDNRF